MKLGLCIFFVVCSYSAMFSQSFDEEFGLAFAKVTGELRAEMQELAVAGKSAVANQKLISAFPEKRSAAQNLIIGNVLFGIAAKLSYEFHEKSYLQNPLEPSIMLEWALQLHRNEEFDKAAEVYEKFLKLNNDFAPGFGLLADCYVNLNDPKKALLAWENSEKAQSGSIKKFESIVCDIKFKNKTILRDDLILRAQKGEEEAVIQLILMDGNHVSDWWNERPNISFLKNDFAYLDKIKGLNLKSGLECLVALWLSEEDDLSEEEVLKIQKKYGYADLDSLPLTNHPGVDYELFSYFLVNEMISHEKFRKIYYPKIYEMAKETKDANLYNLVLHIFDGSDGGLLKLELEAWTQTNDLVFAKGYLLIQDSKNELKLKDEEFQKALKMFPTDSLLCGLAYKCDSQNIDLLLNAIRAEFNGFSRSSMSGMPSAAKLRGYFSSLKLLLEKKK